MTKRSRSLVILGVGWSLGLIALALFLVLGNEEFFGFFVRDPRSCGSVLHIPGDLNALTCQDALKKHVFWVSAALGATILLLFGTPLVASASRRDESSKALRLSMILVAVIAVVVIVVSFFVWRQQIWSVSSG